MTTDDIVHEFAMSTIHAIGKYRPDKARGRFMRFARQWMFTRLDRVINQYALYRVPLATTYLYERGKLDTTRGGETRRAIEAFRPLERWDGKDEPVGRELGPVECAIVNEWQETQSEIS
jgi:hypothetical protein